MTPDPSIRVRFPQYVAQWEQTGEPPNVTLIGRCPLCGKEVTRRTWLGFVEPETDAEVQAMVADRLKDSAVDREVYWTHLATVHADVVGEE